MNGTEVIGFGGLVVGAIGVVVPQWTTSRRDKRTATRNHRLWLRDRRFDTYSAVMAHNAMHAEWRSLFWDPEGDPTAPRAKAPIGTELFARARLVASHATRDLIDTVEFQQWRFESAAMLDDEEAKRKWTKAADEREEQLTILMWHEFQSMPDDE